MNPTAQELTLKSCPICGGPRLSYLFPIGGHRVVCCQECTLTFLNPQPNDKELSEIYGANYFLGGENEAARKTVSELKQATARLYFNEIRRYHGTTRGRLLEVGCGDGDLLAVAESDGWAVTGVEYSSSACEQAKKRLKSGEVHCGELAQAALSSEQFDLCVLSDVIEHVRNPLEFLAEIHRVLKPGGTLFIATPTTDSWSARTMGQKWMEFKPEHLTYFNSQTLQTALFKSAFREIIVQPGWKILSFDYVQKHFERFRVPLITPALWLLSKLLPSCVRHHRHRVVASGMMAFARKHPTTPRPTLSVIIPAYNEAKTFDKLMSTVLRKELQGMEMELIVVESNSTDGTRQLSLKYKDHPRVKVVLEDKPLGKGHAVRTGLAAATGDYVLIQDADLEYDIEDYDALLEPLVAGRNAFVLGSRHSKHGSLKMRQFTGQHGLSLFLNLGHWIFTTLVNVLFAQKLRDPFTMFKVFRRDCLYGLEFKCNRFDFDYELLIKLIRKGYQPLELPINYHSRSFKEGKKVRVFRDPLTWLAVLARLKCEKVDLMKAVECKRRTP